MKHYGYVYKIVCKINNKAYIGQTIRTIEERWASHIFSSKNADKRNLMVISKAIHKYSHQNFSITIICKANNREELNHREKLAIRLFKTKEFGYNLKEGGVGSKHSEETKKKMSEQRKGKPKSPEFKQKLRNLYLGKKRPDWVIKKMSESQKGENGSFYGKHHTKEHKNKMKQIMSCRHVKIQCLENFKTYNSYQEAAEDLNIKRRQIVMFFSSKTNKTAGGFTFKKIT